MSGDFVYQNILDALVSFVKTKSETPEKVAAILIREGFPKDKVESSLEEYKKRAKAIQHAREPRTMVGDVEGWYLGPQPGDHFWPSLENLLGSKGWDSDAITSIDDGSTKVVSLLAPPYASRISTKGLVLGYVQSGKTASYTAVVAKAADAGYKMFIILTGMLEPLRAQTLGRMQNEIVFPNDEDWFSLTSIDSDFKKQQNINPNAFLTDHRDHKILAVLKKNGPILRNLKNWLSSAREEILRNCPVLIIDDEADQASVNTAKPENQPPAINSLIRELRDLFPRCAYVAYTATPFANVLINPDPELEDLYPSDFIVDLPKPPKNIYLGSEAIFGRDRLDLDDSDIEFDGLDMVRHVSDEETGGLKPASQTTAEDFWPELTASLKEAIDYFFLATAARRVRGHHDVHSTMLIHTTLSVQVHDRFKKPVKDYVDRLASSIKRGNKRLSSRLEDLWVREIVAVPPESAGATPVSFNDLSEYLQDVLTESEVVVENSRSLKRLDYSGDRSVYLVIGGNVLSRGLTLEGLIVSFFIRAASTYDTLLQMGRWFGYRPGYMDLPRVWMTEELESHFRDLATIEQEIRNDIRRYELEKLTPMEFAVRIRRHPSLMITSPMKMRHAVPCKISYSGQRPQTIQFYHKDREWLLNNIKVTREFLGHIRTKAEEFEDNSGNGRLVFRGVSSSNILQFIKEYSFHKSNVILDSKLIAKYVNEQNSKGELEEWNVVVMGQASTQSGQITLLESASPVNLVNRAKLHPRLGAEDSADIKALMSKMDLVADIKNPDLVKNFTDTMSLVTEGRKISGGRGLLLIYPIEKDSIPLRRNSRRVDLDAVEHVIGIAMVFPEPKHDTPQDYMSAPIEADRFAEELEGPDEGDDCDQ